MKNTLLSVVILLFALKGFAQKFEWLHVNSTGQVGNQKTIVKSDAQGNIFVAGVFGGMMVIGADTVYSYQSSLCSFMAKYNAAGNHLWTKPFGPVNGSPNDMSIDSNGHIYMSLVLNNSVTYIDDDTTFLFASLYCLVSFDNNGKLKWGISHPKPSQWMPVAASLFSPGFYAASGNGVYRYDVDGNVIWSKTTTPTNFQFRGIECNNASTLAVCGISGWAQTGIFTIDTVSFNIQTSTADMAVLRMDTSGSVIWATVLPNLINGSTIFGIKELLVNSASEIYYLYTNGAAGNLNYVFAADTVFNPLCPTCDYGAVLKFGSNGNPIWAKEAFIQTGHLTTTDFTLNDNEEIIISCYTPGGPVHFGSFTAYNYNNWSMFTGKLSPSGNHLWMKYDYRLFNTLNLEEFAYSVCKGLNNTIVVSGRRYTPSGSALHFGCHSDSTVGDGFFLTSISENQEPVPVVSFDVVQSAGKIVAINSTQNAVSIAWSFGDGSPASPSEQPYHEYAQPGVYNLCLTAYNNCGFGQDCRQIIYKGLREIRNNRGCNDGVITTEIFGGGFTPATTARLLKHSGGAVVPVAILYVDAGKLIARFNLNGEPVTLCDLEVDVPGDTTMIKNDAFSIVPGEPYQLNAAIMGQQAGRPNGYLKQTITIKNNSAKDAVGVPVFFRYRDDNTVHFVYQSFENITSIPFTYSGYQYLQTNGLNTSLADYFITSSPTHSAFGGFVIPLLKAGETYTKTIFIKSTIGQQVGFGVYTLNPMVSNLSLTGTVSQESDFCLSGFFKRAIESTFSTAVSDAAWNSCFPAMQDSIFYSIASKAINLQPTPAVSWNAFLTAALSSIIINNCIPSLPASITNAQLHSVLSKTISNLTFLDDISNGFSCASLNQYKNSFDESPIIMENEFCDLVADVAGTGVNAVFSPLSSLGGASAYCLLFSGSIDPNAKYGAGDNNTDIYVKPAELLPYTITFENLAIASAPASEVFITDTLDLTKLDISTFEFGPVFIADTLLISFDEPGFEHIDFTDIPNSNNQIRTLATVDSVTGVVKWIFSTVYKSDKQPNTNPFEGFLPPNVNGSEGTGICSYVIRAKSTLVTGDQIDNDAEIIFDNNAPIVTNVWTNVVDITPPQSAVNPLLPVVTTTQFTITWGGSDVVAGIRAYKIYVSENDGPYQLLQHYTDSTSLQFNGAIGSKYEFFSIAIDRAGNVEDAPLDPANNPDAVTTVVTGVEEISGDMLFYVFPNPAGNVLNVYSPYQIIDAIRIQDVYGKTVLSVESVSGSHVELNTSSLAQGIYFILMHYSNRSYKTKLIKN